MSNSSAEVPPPPAFQWTPASVAISMALFVAAAVAEIGGGWLMWQTLRVKRPWCTRSPIQTICASCDAAACTSPCSALLRLLSTVFCPRCRSLAPSHPQQHSAPAIVTHAQPTASFGRVYAAYGGFFILLSYAWGWAVDHEAPDRMDCIGTAIALFGVLIAFFWPR